MTEQYGIDSMKYFEVEFNDGFSIACKGLRVPTVSEANIFCDYEVKLYGVVVCVLEIPIAEVDMFFDTNNIDRWPVFQ